MIWCIQQSIHSPPVVSRWSRDMEGGDGLIRPSGGLQKIICKKSYFFVANACWWTDANFCIDSPVCHPWFGMLQSLNWLMLMTRRTMSRFVFPAGEALSKSGSCDRVRSMSQFFKKKKDPCLYFYPYSYYHASLNFISANKITHKSFTSINSIPFNMKNIFCNSWPPLAQLYKSPQKPWQPHKDKLLSLEVI